MIHNEDWSSILCYPWQYTIDQHGNLHNKLQWNHSRFLTRRRFLPRWLSGGTSLSVVMKQLFTQSRDCTVVKVEGLETHNVFLTNQHYARTLKVSGYMLEIEDIPEVRITGRVSKKNLALCNVFVMNGSSASHKQVEVRFYKSLPGSMFQGASWGRLPR